ncbi:hypothetical protein P886_4093 [Alteromonadaceae bacterium 2753L.S.0a.02]|nr:hypothetical protein P886_4093 [Alteromonadaceae bacterium 2753L.S.0a.02]
MGNVIDLGQVREQQQRKQAKISVSLKRIARQNRLEILQSYPFIKFWLSDVKAEHYIFGLHLHLALRKELETQFKTLGASFNVVNQFNDEHKQFDIQQYVSPNHYKTQLIKRDLAELHAFLPDNFELPSKAKELIAYMRRASEVYSVALLGVLFMLEENLCYGGMHLVSALQKNGVSPKHNFRYLKSFSDSKSDLWKFRETLDSISDFQTQANVVIAATISYDMHRELLNPRYFRQQAIKFSQLFQTEPTQV